MKPTVTSGPAGSGILLVDKPKGFTSHDAVARVRRLAGTRKVGHAGTLDPMATGLLTIGLNSSTRLLTHLVGLDKEYLATIRLGASTTTDDAEGDVIDTASADAIASVSDDNIAIGMRALSGAIAQVPSTFSAIKVDGRRSYDRARAGESIELAARSVMIAAFELIDTRRGDFIDLDVRVECSTGTYIRALARDLGSDLGVGGHLTALRRTRVGPFSVSDASPLDSLDPASSLLTPASVARRLFPVVEVTATEVVAISQGKRVPTQAPENAGPVAAMGPDGRLVALVSVTSGELRVVTGFPAAEVVE